MGDEVREDPAVPKREPSLLVKAGWMKKASGRFLASYKDRFIQLEKTEMVVYENEDLKICSERLDLEKYDKCQELKSTFKKKNRLVLIRAPQSGNKVHDVKLQARNPEEKEAWIKALTDGINRAKNKIFDEVKVDEGSNLDHVTRSRPKGNRHRRPPTRIHMKEIASVSSDGILRLDLDLEDATIPNGTSHIIAPQVARPSKPAPTATDTIEEEPAESVPDEEPQEEEEPQKKTIKPPMPPSKQAKPAEAVQNETSKEEASEKKVLKPPMPPSKEAKPTVPAQEEEPMEEEKVLKPPMPPSKEAKPTSPAQEEEPAKVLKPPMPPSKEAKPTVPAQEEEPMEAEEEKVMKELPTPSTEDKAEALEEELAEEEPDSAGAGAEVDVSAPHPEPPKTPSAEDLAPVGRTGAPTPPPKDHKPSAQNQQPVPSESDSIPGGEEEGISANGEEEDEEGEDIKPNGVPETAEEAELSTTPAEESLPAEGEAEESTLSPAKAVSTKEEDSASSPEIPRTTERITPSSTPQPIKKSPGPPAPPKKSMKVPPPRAAAGQKAHLAEEPVSSELEEKPQIDVPPLTEATAGCPDADEAKCRLQTQGDLQDQPSLLLLPEDKREQEEEKSVDSGRHSDVDSERSDGGDVLAASCTALGGSPTPLDISDDDAETSTSLGRSTDDEPPPPSQSPVSSKLQTSIIQKQLNSCSRPQIPPKPSVKARCASLDNLLSESPADQAEQPPADEASVEEPRLELQETGQQVERAGLEGVQPDELLNKALERLEKPDQFLRERKSLKLFDNSESRLQRSSW